MERMFRIEKRLFDGEYVDLSLEQLKEMVAELENQNTTDHYNEKDTCVCENIEFTVNEDLDLELTKLFY